MRKHSIWASVRSESQLLLASLCILELSEHTSKKKGEEKACARINRWMLTRKQKQKLTCLSSCIRSFMIPCYYCPLNSRCLLGVCGDDDGAAGRRPTGRRELDRERRASGGSERRRFPPHDLAAGMVEPLYRAGWRADKVRRGLPPLTHYTPTTSSIRTNWRLFVSGTSLFCEPFPPLRWIFGPTACRVVWQKNHLHGAPASAVKLCWLWLTIEQVQR